MILFLPEVRNILSVAEKPTHQCDQMARLFFNNGPLIAMEIRPKAKQFAKDDLKFCKIQI